MLALSTTKSQNHCSVYDALALGKITSVVTGRYTMVPHGSETSVITARHIIAPHRTRFVTGRYIMIPH